MEGLDNAGQCLRYDLGSSGCNVNSGNEDTGVEVVRADVVQEGSEVLHSHCGITIELYPDRTAVRLWVGVLRCR